MLCAGHFVVVPLLLPERATRVQVLAQVRIYDYDHIAAALGIRRLTPVTNNTVLY